MTFIAWTLNAMVAVLYALASLAVFAAVLAASIVSPVIVGALLFMALKEMPGGEKSSIVILPFFGGVLASALIAIGSVRGLGRVLSGLTPGVKNNTAAITEASVDVAWTLHVKPFRACYVDGGTGAYTYLTGGGKYIVIGCHALRYLAHAELRAVVAHEYGHHLHGAMLVNRVHYWITRGFEGYSLAIQAASSTTTSRSSRGGTLTYVWQFAGVALIVELVFFFVFVLYLRVCSRMLKHSDYEYYCDSVAIRAVGGEHLASALDKLADLALAHQAAVAAWTQEEANAVNSEARMCEAVDREYERLREFGGSARDKARTNESGTHPPLTSRIQRAGSVRPVTQGEPVCTQSERIAVLRELRVRNL